MTSIPLLSHPSPSPSPSPAGVCAVLHFLDPPSLCRPRDTRERDTGLNARAHLGSTLNLG